MKITGTRSQMFVEFDQRMVTIPGELTMEPAFYAELNALWKWDDGAVVTEEEKSGIIDAVNSDSAKKMRIIFD